jgi:transposase-like protein
MPKTKEIIRGTVSLSDLAPKKKRFVELYRETRGFISDIARAVGITRQRYYQWLDEDKNFALAVMDAEAEINDEMKQELIRQAQADNNTTALIFWLKNKHPEFKPQRETNVQVNIANVIAEQKSKYELE